MERFRDLQHKWGEFLTHTGDIYSDVNLTFLRSVQEITTHEDIADELFYLQKEAGFYRFRIIEVLGPQGEKYQVNFHVFPDSKTHIHFHGYAANSWVLRGNLECANFLVHDDIPEENKNNFFKLFGSANMSRFLNKQKGIVNQEMGQLLMGRNIVPSHRTNTYAAMLGECGLFSDIEAGEYYTNLVKNGQDWGAFTKPHEVMGIVQNGGKLYRLEKDSQKVCREGETYHFSHDIAHAVHVTGMAVTLFLTCKKNNGEETHEGEFHHFPEMPMKHRVPVFKGSDIKQEILGKLQSIDI